jgi:cell division septal protein FtsQ
MIFSLPRRAKNRKVETTGREQRLDVKVNVDAEQASYTRAAWRSLVFIGVVVALVVLWRQARAILLTRWIHQIPALALRDYPITTDGVLTREEIQQTVGVTRGENVLAIDLPTVRDRLRLHPRIEDATVERVLPGTLRLNIREREPVARINVLSAQGLTVNYLLDESGHALLPLQPSRRNREAAEAESALPMIVGSTGTDFSPGRATALPDVLAALRFLDAFDASEMAGLTEILSVDLSNRGVLQAVTSHGSLVTFRLEEFNRQLRDWHRIWQRGAEMGHVIGTLDLAVSRNIPLRWQEGPGTPDLPPKGLKPKRKRRTNV